MLTRLIHIHTDAVYAELQRKISVSKQLQLFVYLNKKTNISNRLYFTLPCSRDFVLGLKYLFNSIKCLHAAMYWTVGDKMSYT